MSNSTAANGTHKTLAIRPCQTFQGHSRWVRGVIYLLCGQRIMTCSADGSLRVWNLKTGEQVGDAWRDGENGVFAIALSPDGKKVVCGCVDGAVKLWDIGTCKFIAKWTGHTNYVTSVCWNRYYGRVASASGDGTARVWDVESGKTVLAIETGLGEPWAVVYSPDMTMIATGGDSKDSSLKEFIKIWDAKTGKLITNPKGHTKEVSCLAWTADGSTLVSGSYDYSIRTWNTTTWQQIHVLTGHIYVVFGIAISPNGPDILASASWDGTARLWNLENGLPIGLPLQHPDPLQCVSFSTDGKLLATGCRDKNAYSWDISGFLREAGLLGPNDSDKSLIDADATRRPGHRRRDVHRIPSKIFDDAPRHPHPFTTRHLSPSSARHHNITVHPYSHKRTRLGRFSSLFQRNYYNAHDASPRLHFLEWPRSTFVHLPRERNDEGLELQERRLAVVNVPFTRGKPRNYSAGELRRKEEKEKQKALQARNAKNAQNKKDTMNASGAAQAQSTSQVRVVTSTLFIIPAVAATSATMTMTLHPEVIVPQAGCWTRFWLFFACVPPQYTDGQ